MNLLLSKQMKKTKGRKQFGFYEKCIEKRLLIILCANNSILQAFEYHMHLRACSHLLYE